MDIRLTADETAFRTEVRDFLATHLTERLRAGARATPTVFAEPDIGREWQHILYEKGWLAYFWPVAFGGTGWTPMQRYIFEKECALAHAPELPGLSLKLLAPVLHRFGTPEQQARYLPRILSADDYWCQGFSEPGSGSDLASLKTRAVRDGDRWIVNGSKLWTTHAHFADHMFCLVRTNPDVKRQAGISFLLIDMKQPGIEVRPIMGLAGDHEVNAVFLDDVSVPADDMVGSEGQGWTIAKFLLENERGGSCHAPSLLADLDTLRAAASQAPADGGGTMADDALFIAALSHAEFAAQALETTELRILAEIAQGRPPGPQTSLVKLVASNLKQDIGTLAMRLWGPAGLQLPTERPLYGNAAPEPILNAAAQIAAPTYLNNRAWTIFGGSNEVQRTIIAKTVLGL
ncbi:acyl-CoA dehydrogenase family protein [uncultured Sphingomonas sp.]|uniref:acyl-CoA dehydrogenase family protein n=1 Tax=uncultured Sphingomonas sp. TaxID=158754 RepID=UPI002625C990|nr:acyl-CoA dehydrogenase family protein [uncultured Sphingomonas sp.]